MLRGNLATRPFYNDRAVRLGIGVVAVLALGLTAYNAVEGWRLQAANAELARVLQENERQARDLRQKAQAIRQSLNKEQLTRIQADARVANELIDRRAFSWTELLNQFQVTLPADVRIAAVQPQVDPEGRMLVAVTVVSRRIEDLDEFIEALEKTGAFTGVLSRQDTAEPDGTLRSILQGYYARPDAAAQPAAAEQAPSASETGKVAP